MYSAICKGYRRYEDQFDRVPVLSMVCLVKDLGTDSGLEYCIPKTRDETRSHSLRLAEVVSGGGSIYHRENKWTNVLLFASSDDACNRYASSAMESRAASQW